MTTIIQNKIKPEDEENLKKMLLKFDSTEIEKIIKVGKNLVKEKKIEEKKIIMNQLGNICYKQRHKIFKSDLDKNIIKQFEICFDLSAAGEYFYKNKNLIFEKVSLPENIKSKIEKLLTNFDF